MDIKKEVTRLQNKVSKWLSGWVVNPTMIQNIRDEPVQVLQGYLGGQSKVRRVGSRSQNIHFWHLVHYQQAVLNEGGKGLEHLALAVVHAEAYIRFEEAFAENGMNGSILQPEASLMFSLAVIAGWSNTADGISKALVRGLDTSLLDLRHTDRHRAGEVYRSFWFIMHLQEKVFGRRINKTLYSYPKDMAPYQVVLDGWNTSDLAKVQEWVCAMADFHVQETRNTSHDEIEEFDTEDVMLFPYEILCWLRLREWAGLKNPETFDHPLMQQPLAKLPTPVPLSEPGTPLLDQVIAKFKQEFPRSFT